MSGHVHREFPGTLESSNLSRNNLSGEIGRRGSPVAPGEAAQDEHAGGDELVENTTMNK